MPFVTAEDGVRVHYELEGPEDGIPLVLHHGSGSNLGTWRQHGYVDLLRDRFRLVLVDSRGYGESDKPIRVEDYDYRTRALDVVATMRDAAIERAHFWGYSMGGQIVQSAAIYAPQRFRSLVIGGSSPFGARDLVNQLPLKEAWARIQELRPSAQRGPWEAEFPIERAFGGAVQALRTTKLPFLLYAGADDAGPHRGLREFVGKYGARHFTLPGKDHPAAMRESAATVVPQVTAFIDEVEAASK